ncbi:MAG TPA: hypothetical protein VIL04_12365 [Solirubrobacterales bacterium]
MILKIPVLALLWLVWWAWRAEHPVEPASDDGGGANRFGRFRRQPKRPRGPRRGPHAPDTVPLPACPPGGRVRVFTPPAPVRAASAHNTQRGSAEPAEH